MKNIHKLLFILIIFTVLLIPSYSVRADDNNTANDKTETAEKSTKKQKIVDCNGIFGDPSKEDSTIFMIQKILNYVKILAPLLVVLLSGFDFAKNALTGDQDEMKKAGKKLGIRLGCAVGVYLAPLLAGFLINFINNTSIDRTCKLK